MKTITLTKWDLRELLSGKVLDDFQGVKVKVRIDPNFLREYLGEIFFRDDF